MNGADSEAFQAWCRDVHAGALLDMHRRRVFSALPNWPAFNAGMHPMQLRMAARYAAGLLK